MDKTFITNCDRVKPGNADDSYKDHPEPQEDVDLLIVKIDR